MSNLSLFSFIVMTLVVWRVSVLIAADEGPFSLIEKARSRIDPHQSTWLGRGVRCVGCVSFWASLAAALIVQASVWEWLGMAGGALLIHKAVTR